MMDRVEHAIADRRRTDPGEGRQLRRTNDGSALWIGFAGQGSS